MATTSAAERHVDTDRPGARVWMFVVAVGVVLALLGAVALFTPAIAGVSTTIVLGVTLVVTGLVEGLAALRRVHQRGLGRTLLAGLLSVVVGVSLVAFPLRGLAGVTSMIGAFFLVAGLFRTITSMLDRYVDWGWDLGYGVAVALLGTYVLTGWSGASPWALGTLVGIELLLRGGAWIGAGSALRALEPAGPLEHSGPLEQRGGPSYGRR